MEDACSKQGFGEKALLKFLCPEKLKFCIDNINSHMIVQMRKNVHG